MGTDTNSDVEVEQIRRLSVRARSLLVRLQPMKFQTSGPARHPDERLVTRNPGPRGPAVGEAAIDLELDLTFVLREDLVNLAELSETPAPPRGLGACLDWVYTWAPDVADRRALLAAVENVVVKLADFVEDKPETNEVWETASVLVYRLARLGIQVNDGQLRTWAARGHVASVKEGNHNLYRLRDVLNYLDQRITI